MSLRDAFEAEHLRREKDRLAREDAERAQQEADHARANALFEALAAEGEFLTEKRLLLDRTRYAVTLDHDDFRLRVYFEDGEASVTSADKRTATTPSAAPRKQATVKSVAEALDVLAQYLADEVR
ncbi:MAG TPA: hypothetical protein VFW47_17180 [Phenylobacterium sp.]|nr:hypothetical protein [Phenylobacterium sp.]